MSQNPSPEAGPEAGPEQRKSPRYEVSAYIDCMGSEVYLHHKLLNISLGGICFRCDSPEAIGTEVEVGKIDGQQKRLPARVVRFPFYDPEKLKPRS